MRPYQRGRGHAHSKFGGNSNRGRGRAKSREVQRDRPGWNTDDIGFQDTQEIFHKSNFRNANRSNQYQKSDETSGYYHRNFEENSGSMEQCYDRDDYNFVGRERHASDTFEYLERDRYSRDNAEFADKEYDRFYERDNINERRDRDGNFVEDIRVSYSRDNDTYENRSYNKDERDPYDDRRYDMGDNYDFQHPHDYDRRDLHDYQNRETLGSEQQYYNEERVNDARDRRRNFKRAGYENYYFDSPRQERYKERNWHKRIFSENKNESTDIYEPLEEGVLSSQSNQRSYDWPTNESGIKMAIEFLKNKPTNVEPKIREEESVVNQDSEEELNNLPVIKPELLGKEAIEDLISDLLNLLLKNGGEFTVIGLEKEFVSTVKHRFKDDKVLKPFLQKYPKVFEFDTEKANKEEDGLSTEGIELVRAKSDVKLCQAHSNHPKSCQGDCDALHICKFYVLSSCDMIKCKFGHNLSDDHNIEVQQKFYLHRVELPNLCLLLQHDANRCRVTVPIICHFYNSLKGCRSKEKMGNQQQQQKCPFLHICRNFVEGRCNIWSSCRRNHSLLQGNVYEILCKYGLDPRVLVDGLTRDLALLKWSLTDFKDELVKTGRRYMSNQLGMDEEKSDFTKERLKRKVQVGGDDVISVKIQKVMDTSLSSVSSETNSQETSIEEKRNVCMAAKDLIEDTALKLEKDGASPAGKESYSKKISKSSTVLNNKTTNKVSGKDEVTTNNIPGKDEATNNQVPENDENATNHIPCWSIADNNKWTEISQKTIKDLETKYQNYLAAKTATVLVDGKYFTVDFNKLSGCYSGSAAIVKLKRAMVKEPVKP
ncbi:uncharacterized protein LOC127738394 [Mytilus californianus]|uniref:uncharacterized protein LOC127738394 n=1 Tax=Mytilus californianus TaxID=6549 RepID=UPI00224567C1|nr:uncharacterized protein LOC127738394 [Mytilus californianus]XP_052105589.1 uncharacterized protein LOC127738394 [Mytilus californianus]